MIVVAAAAVFPSAPVEAAPLGCVRWAMDQMSDCDILKKPSTCSVVGVEHDLVNQIKFSSSAKQACKKYLKIVQPSVSTFEAWPIDSDGDGEDDEARCAWDYDRDRDIDFNDWTVWGYVVTKRTITPLDHCKCTSNNSAPYKGLAWSGKIGVSEAYSVLIFHAFPKDLKKAILDDNYTSHGNMYKSDANTDPHQTLQKDNIYDIDAAEIDHIIPRTDSQGCICGDPTPDNAALVSREINAKMSNTSPKWDPDRAALFQQYVTCPNPEFGAYQGPFAQSMERGANDLEQHDVDETVMDVEARSDNNPQRREAPAAQPVEDSTGGCSTTSGGVGALVGLLGLCVRRRRR